MLERHTHSRLSGGKQVRHSHDGPQAHRHPDYGPATYTIDRDEWARKTGLRGGGRKSYTKRPTGKQL